MPGSESARTFSRWYRFRGQGGPDDRSPSHPDISQSTPGDTFLGIRIRAALDQGSDADDASSILSGADTTVGLADAVSQEENKQPPATGAGQPRGYQAAIRGTGNREGTNNTSSVPHTTLAEKTPDNPSRCVDIFTSVHTKTCTSIHSLVLPRRC